MVWATLRTGLDLMGPTAKRATSRSSTTTDGYEYSTDGNWKTFVPCTPATSCVTTSSSLSGSRPIGRQRNSVSRPTVTQFLARRGHVTAEMALRLAQYFGTSA